MKTFEGKNGVKATVVCDSVSPDGNRLVTFECEYPRIIHAEVMTHRMFSRNAASSRAIPLAKMLEQLHGMPVRFGPNQAGMQDTGVDHNAPVQLLRYTDFQSVYDEELYEANVWGAGPEYAWEQARDSAVEFAKAFSDAGYHKQICNRLTEPFQMMKVLISSTEMPNFFWLRKDEAADPTLQELANVMQQASEASTPTELGYGEWHLPYVCVERHGGTGEQVFFLNEPANWGECLGLEEAIKVSAARCAAVSYRNTDYDLEKSIQVYERLVGAEKKHGSALEHQAKVMVGARCDIGINFPKYPNTWEDGISHMDKEGNLWSGNFKGFIQHRKTIKGENYLG